MADGDRCQRRAVYFLRTDSHDVRQLTEGKALALVLRYENGMAVEDLLVYKFDSKK